jgi:hypothetical protein
MTADLVWQTVQAPATGMWRWEIQIRYSERPLARSHAEFHSERAAEHAVETLFRMMDVDALPRRAGMEIRP